MGNRIRTALNLMQSALELLDAEGETRAAAHLQGAIDAACGEHPMRPGDELDPLLAVLFEELSDRKH